jgi:hypothetical protein
VPASEPRISPASFVEQRPEGVVIRVRVKPRASRDQIEGPTPDGLLAVRLSAPPVENQANTALIELLARTLRRPKSAFTLIAGDKSRQKSILVTGLAAAEVEQKLRGT